MISYFLRCSIFLLLFTFVNHAQSYIISEKIDSLQNQLINNKQYINVNQELLNEYLEYGEAELALLELIELEHNTLDTNSFFEEKGKILFWLDEQDKANKYLERAFNVKPSADILAYLLVAKYSANNVEKSLLEFTNYGDKNTLSEAIFSLFRLLREKGKTSLAQSAKSLIKEADENLYGKYFLYPVIDISGYQEEFVTSGDSFTVSFTVSHEQIIDKVLINDKTVFDNSKLSSQKKAVYSKYFKEQIPIQSGWNNITISASDELDNQSQENFRVLNLKFDSIFDSESEHAKKLIQSQNLLYSYIPKDLININKNPSDNAILISTQDLGNKSENPSRLKFWQEFFSSNLVSPIPLENVITLINDHISEKIIDIVFNDWIIKDKEQNTKIVLYLDAELEIDSDTLYINTAQRKINLSNKLEALINKSSFSVFIILDNHKVNNQRTQNYFREFVANSSIPTGVLILNKSNNPSLLLTKLFDLDSAPETDVKIEDDNKFGLKYLFNLYDGSIAYSNNDESLAIFSHPTIKISQLLSELYNQLQEKLSIESNTSIDQEVVLNFCNNWKRISEIKKYLNSEITSSELEIQAKEFYSRNETIIE